jgi:hypothetical protein
VGTSPAIVRLADDLRRIVREADHLVRLADDLREIVV